MSKMLKFHEDALQAIFKGVKTLSKAVLVTLGPGGRNVVITKPFGLPSSTKDGVFVAKEIALKDKFENMGAQLVKEAAIKTAEIAGDGTTTSIVLSDAIFSEGFKHLTAGVNPMELKKGMDKAVSFLEKKLDEIALPIQTPQEIFQIATISANQDKEIGQIISDALQKVGKDGIVTIGEAKGIETTLEVVEGMQFDKGYLSPYFVTNHEKMSVEFDHPLIFITDKKLTSASDVVPILEKIIEGVSRPLLIIAEDVEQEALATLVINKIKAGVSLCAVKAPSFGDRRKAILKDLAVLTGAQVMSDEAGVSVEEFDFQIFGSCEKVLITKEETTIVGGKGSLAEIETQVAQIRRELNQKELSDYDRKNLEERLAKLKGGVAVVHVGALTEVSLNEKKDRIEDALHATRAAIREGIVPGGGVALIRAASFLKELKCTQEEAIGVEIIRKACFFPAITIANNCGKIGSHIAEKIEEQKGSFGYNGYTDSFSDLIQDGVIDPVLVTKSALRYSASVAGMLLTISVMITDDPSVEKKAALSSTGMGGMGGMPGMGGMGGMGF